MQADKYIQLSAVRLFIVLVVIAYTSNVAAATLEVSFDGLHDRQGLLHVTVAADEMAWSHTKAPAAVRDIDLASATLPLRVTFDNLEPGRYAVEAYQDLNANGKLDFNFMHIPKEPVGDSRNPNGWRRPRFDECVFVLSAEGMRIEIALK